MAAAGLIPPRSSELYNSLRMHAPNTPPVNHPRVNPVPPMRVNHAMTLRVRLTKGTAAEFIFLHGFTTTRACLSPTSSVPLPANRASTGFLRRSNSG
jgi:hypothetical protein